MGRLTQSSLHQDLSWKSLDWLAARSTQRGILGTTEVVLAQGYVADAVALAGLQHRLLVRYLDTSGLVEKFVREDGNGGLEETGDVRNELVCVFEVKVSRRDYLSTFDGAGKKPNRHSPVGSMHWCVTPRGMVEPQEVPNFWGLLQPRGSGLQEVKSPTMFVVSEILVHRVAYEILKRGRRAKVIVKRRVL